jgi:hypothetical protein
LLFRRSFLNQLGLYRTDLMIGEDGELFFRALTSSPRVEFTSRALTLYRLHNIVKLTQDEGTSRARRVTDWAWCLHYMIERCQSSGLKMDLMTRSILLSGIQKHLRSMEQVPDAPRELAGELSNYTLQLPGFWLSAIEAWLRVREQLRLRLRGSRWMPGYQAGPLTDNQRELIQQLSLQVS